METEGILLRSWRESDAAALYKMHLDDSIRKSGIYTFSSVEECTDILHSWGTEEYKAIISKADGQLCGMIMLGDMNRYEGYLELEYSIAAQYRGKGYATHAVRLMTEYGFRELGAEVIVAWVRSHNTASVRVLEKCGFTFEGRLRRHARDKSDTLCYSMLREELLK